MKEAHGVCLLSVKILLPSIRGSAEFLVFLQSSGQTAASQLVSWDITSSQFLANLRAKLKSRN